MSSRTGIGSCGDGGLVPGLQVGARRSFPVPACGLRQSATRAFARADADLQLARVRFGSAGGDGSEFRGKSARCSSVATEIDLRIRRRIEQSDELRFGDGIEAAGDFFRRLQFGHGGLFEVILVRVEAEHLEQEVHDAQIVRPRHHAQRAHPFSDQGMLVAQEVLDPLPTVTPSFCAW